MIYYTTIQYKLKKSALHLKYFYRIMLGTYHDILTQIINKSANLIHSCISVKFCRNVDFYLLK